MVENKTKTKIIATIGPSCFDYSTLKKMHLAGMTFARINTKYASMKEIIDIKKMLDGIGSHLIVDLLNYGSLKRIDGLDIDYFALSFTESSKQIKQIRKYFPNKKIFIIAKIESKKGINNIKEIINESDGIMVARGDLGKHIAIEKLPIFQKIILKQCKKKRKMGITATEMLLSMTKSKVPERSEATDVANAVIDGSQAVMLSEETAIGKYPVLAVKTMKSIIAETEKYMAKNNLR
mgnify:CR=1 FL=1